MRARSDDLMGLAIGGLLATAVSQGVGRFVYTPILPVMAQALGLSGSATGLIASANFLGYLLGALATALPNIPGSRRFWMVGGLVASSVTTGAVGLGSDPVVLAVIRFLGGFSSALVLVYASALVLDRLNAAGRGGLSAVLFAGIGAGILASSLLVSGLIAAGAGWRVLWFSAALICAIATAFVIWLVPPAPVGLMARIDDSPRPPTRVGPLARLVTAYGLFGFGYVVTATYLIAIVRAHPDTAPLAPWIWPLTGLAGIPSVALWNEIGRRFGLYRSYALAHLLEAFGVAASVLWPGPGGPIVAAVLLGGTFIGLSALGLVGARNLSGSDPKRVIGMMTAAFGIGQILGPGAAGIAFDLTGSFLLPSLAAVTTLLIGAVLVWGIRIPPSTIPASAGAD